jgi:hypothetical protein
MSVRLVHEIPPHAGDNILFPFQPCVNGKGKLVVGHFEIDMEASQTRDDCAAQKSGASRGSPRSFATQKRLAQDDNFKLTRYREMKRALA